MSNYVGLLSETESEKKLPVIRYSSNNSGGDWWLEDKHWTALAAHGWNVEWVADRKNHFRADKDGRWMGALATSATRTGLTRKEAVAEFERITGEDTEAAGCECCGPPHSFYET